MPSYPKNGQNKSGDIKRDPVQIAFLTNNRTSLAACDSLKTADLSDGKEKSPSGIHHRFSRIKINVTDFSKTPTVFLSFYLKPQEIRRLYRRILVSQGEKTFSFSSSKKKERGDKVFAEMMSVERDPFRYNYQTKSYETDPKSGKKVPASHPWKITIASGEYKNGQNSKPTYDKRAFKSLTDDEVEDFFATVISFLDVWEVVFGATLLKKIAELPRYESKEVEFEEEAPETPSVPKQGQTNGGQSPIRVDDML